MATAIVVHSDVGAGPAICTRLATEGFAVHSIDTAAADRASVAAAVAGATAHGIDLLVNNAPRFDGSLALDLSADRFAAALAVGLHGVFSACREAARTATDLGTKLTVVNIVSTLAMVGLPGRAAEACVSAGVLAATKALAAEWGPLGIRVVAIMVGPTGSWLSSSRSMGEVPGVLPLGVLVSDDDVANAVAVMAGPDAVAVSGQALIVDAGWLAHGWRRE
jgi:NAD(P)-dependent dehydrogenase (short-subunit alcohol dehydrogenase family)